jgi:hypothetical protein
MKLSTFLALCAIAATPAVAQTESQPRDLQLFLLIGQSNMAGRGTVEAQDREPIPRVWMLTKDLAWVPAIDPVHFDKTVAGVGIGRSFAKVLTAANPSASIGLIPAAMGGSSLDEWKPGSELYNDAVRRTKAALKNGKLRGILWHQGESDTHDDGQASSYRQRFVPFIRQLRADLNAPDVPVLVGQLSETFDNPHRKTVDEQLALIPLLVSHAAFVTSAGLSHQARQAHFNAAELREFGRRYGYSFLMLDPLWTPANGR